MTTSRRHLALAVAAVVLVAVLAGAGLATIYRGHDARAVLLPDQVMTSFAQPKPLTAFTLNDHDGQPFDLARLRGRWSFVFFGFTHCPDICPTTLATLARVRSELADGDAQFVFVSVDSRRDNAARLKQYTASFDSRFVGVTGADAELRKLAGQLGVVFQASTADGAGGYAVVHSAAVFLVDPRARYHAVFTAPFDARAMGSRFRALREIGAVDATGGAPRQRGGLLRLGQHVVDRGPDLGVAQRRVAALGRHDARAGLQTLEGAPV